MLRPLSNGGLFICYTSFMKPRIIFVHGNSAMSWNFAWSAWLKQNLEDLGYPTYFETMPDSIIARYEYWIPFLQDYAKVSAEDVIVGWSSGAVAAMRYAENHKLKGSILVSPSVTDLGDDLEKQSGYFDKPWNWKAIKNNQERIALFYGNDDPYIPQEEFQQVAQSLNPQVFEIKQGKHFIEQDTFPELLSYIKANY